MKIPFATLLRPLVLGTGIVVQLPLAGGAATAPVYDTGAELLTAGDFNGDGAADVLVLDKATGNFRAGLLDAGGNLHWSAPLPSGVENATACAVGRFLQPGQDAVAVTGPGLNRIHLLSLTDTNNPATPVVITPPLGIGPHTLVALDNPAGAANPITTNLLVASSENTTGLDLIEWLQVSGGSATIPFPGSPFSDTGYFDRGNALKLTPSSSPSFAGGLVRGLSADRFDILGFTNGADGSVLTFSNLPPGSDYAFGNFNNETLPRFAFYQPGTSNLLLVQLQSSAGHYTFGASSNLALNEAIVRAFYLPPTSTGTFLVEFSDGVQAITLSNGAPVSGAVFRTGLANSNNVFTGIVPLANGQFVALDAAAGAADSTHAQVVRFNGSQFSTVSSSALPPLSSRAARANVWLFQNEPFVTRDPGFVTSSASPDWSDRIAGLPASLSIVKETDAGSGSGLGQFATNNLGAPSAGANYGLANQVADGISVFSYAPARGSEPVTISILPTPGIYSGPVQVTFSTLAAGDQVYYRAGTMDSWHSYAAAFWITNDTSVEYYGVSLANARSRLLTADYYLATSLPKALTLNLTNGFGVTNDSPSGGIVGGSVSPSADGTVYYGRKNATGGTIWAINLDGSDDGYITDGARPRVSHDGRYLAFMRGTNVFDTGGDLWLHELTSGQEWLLLSNTNSIAGYDWDFGSPPHLVVAYGCNILQASVSNGAVVIPVVDDCYLAGPSVNPVNGNLAFFNAGSAGGLWTSLPAGGAPAQLGATPQNSRWPAWSPDGSHLALANFNNPLATNGMADLYTLNADGTGLAQISAFSDLSDGFPFGALWTPTGTGLLGAGTIYGTNGLWLIPLTSDGQQCECPAKLLPTTPGDPIDFAGTVLVAPPDTVAKPPLFIRWTPNVRVVYWSTNNPGFHLQSTISLGLNTSWTNVAGPYYLNGTHYEYHETNTASVKTRFYRLQYPGGIVIQP